MTFDILQHLDQLKPDGGTNNPRGDQSFHCPNCGAKNFKVNVVTGKWFSYGCDCASTEEGKRAIRQALSPARPPAQDRPLNLQGKTTALQSISEKNYPKPAAKPASKKGVRPQAERAWTYCDREGNPILEVLRSDDGKGNRKIRQRSLIKGRRPREVASQVVPQGFHQAKQALEDGAPFVFIPEGEPCADAMRGLGLEAVATLGGCNGFNGDRDGGHFDPTRVVVVPDQDACGVKYARKVAAAYPGCRWLLPYPGTAEWNGSMPKDGGLDVADWIAEGATITDVVEGVLDANPFEVIEPVATPLEEWEELLETLVDPDHIGYERNVVRRQIRAATAAAQLKLRVSPDQVRQRLQKKTTGPYC
ncbi:hypothetical protein SynA18461_02217 [Synechococcus sp. A18-46.1]|nr:hypothetical protein SynA18461_02217 [Synechococcus sp. A18-46.1]